MELEAVVAFTVSVLEMCGQKCTPDRGSGKNDEDGLLELFLFHVI